MWSQPQQAHRRRDRIEALAAKLGLPRAALEGRAPLPLATVAPPSIPFADPDPFHELRFTSVIAAKLAIADIWAGLSPS